MKICFLTSNHLPEAAGGTEQVTAALERELLAAGDEVVAITSSDVADSKVEATREEWEGTVVHRLFKRPDEWDNSGFVRPRLLDRVRAILGAERPDVLHVHSTAALGTGCAAVAAELGIPIVWTFHDLWTTCARYFRVPRGGVRCPDGVDLEPCVTCLDSELVAGRERVAGALRARRDRIGADLALVGACSAPSVSAARAVRAWTPFGGAIEVIPHGLLRAVPAEHLAEGRRPGEPVRVGSFGGLGAEKGTIELCESLAGLPCEVRFAGRCADEGFGAAVERLRAAGTSVSVRGAYGPGDRHPARDLDLAVFPSKCLETYGLVVDEALAHGVPCVVSDRGGLADRAGQPGVVVAPLAKLAETLHDLVSEPERIDALRAAIPDELPTIARAAVRYRELYRSLA